MAPIDAVLDKLEGVKQQGASYLACCPAHDDHTPSLSVTPKADGKVLLKCQAGCSTSEIVAELGLEMKDLFPPKPQRDQVVAEYEYRDETGELLFVVERRSPKKFLQKKPAPGGGWDYKLNGVRRVLFRLPELLEGIAANRWCVIVEGEKDVLALVERGFVATTNVAGAAKWRPEFAPFFVGAKVAVIGDNDKAGREHVAQVCESLSCVAQTVRVAEFPELPEHGDVSDWLAAGGTAEQLRALITDAAAWEPPSEMSPNGDNGKPETSTAVEVLPDEDGALLLDELVASLTRYVVFPSEPAVHAVLASWIAATHAQPAWQHATRLVLKSPEKRCAKSKVLDLIEATCHKPLVTVNASVAAIFRSIDAENPPTLIVDEADTIWTKKSADGSEDLRGLFNAGFGRGRPAIRCVGPSQVPTEFATFAMVALAAIGDTIPDTITDRAVVISMRRRAPGEQVAPYRHRRDAIPLRVIGQRLAVWVGAHQKELEHAVPDLPVEDRAGDLWEPLCAVADLAGGEWCQRARSAAVSFTHEADTAAVEESLNQKLLADLRDVLGEKPAVSSADLVSRLLELPESPWERFGFTQADLACRLKGYGVRPDRVRPDGEDGKQVRGYKSIELNDVFERYLKPKDEEGDDDSAPPPSQRVTPSHSQVSPVTPENRVTGEGVTPPEPVTEFTRHCDTKTDSDVPYDDDELAAFQHIRDWNATVYGTTP